MTARAFRQSLALRALVRAFLFGWCVVALFPIAWVALMSVKLPVDAFADSPLTVILGPQTRASGHGLSLLDIAIGGSVIFGLVQFARHRLPIIVRQNVPGRLRALAWMAAAVALAFAAWALLLVLLPAAMGHINPLAGPLGTPVIGFTPEHYRAVWFERGFILNFWNSVVVTSGVITLSLTVGTLAGYALSRSRTEFAFWLLVVALIFRALPHSVLVTGYLPVFINSSEYLRPFLGDAAPTLYGTRIAVIAVLVSINQPFTIWMLRSFFQNIPSELDEAARVDGCTHFQAFRWVILPVMWPGVITTGLFSFLLAYNDYLVTSLLLDAKSQTMVPAITSMFNQETTATDQVQAVAAAVSITAPLFFLVMAFQRQLVSGLTAGAVKG